MVGESESKTRNCLFYGCLTVILVGVFSLVAVYFAGRYAINKLINNYTSPAPATMPAVQLSDEQYTNVVQRVDAFRDSLKFQTNAVTLTLSADEINALIAKDARFADMKGRAHVVIEGDKINGTVSIPLDKLGGKLQGRYLNGKATFKASIEDGEFILKLNSLEVNGQMVPDQIMVELRKENLARDMQNDPATAAMVGKIDSLQVKDSKIVITTKLGEDKKAPEPEGAKRQ
ncbi:MAG: hypothetical protein AB1705_12625 [Verrucomicrobiota bacterium]